MIVILTRMSMAMMVPAVEQKDARDIDEQAEHRNWDRLVEADRDRCDETRYGLIASTIALVKPANSPSLPVPKVKRWSPECRRA